MWHVHCIVEKIVSINSLRINGFAFFCVGNRAMSVIFIFAKPFPFLDLIKHQDFFSNLATQKHLLR